MTGEMQRDEKERKRKRERGEKRAKKMKHVMWHTILCHQAVAHISQSFCSGLFATSNCKVANIFFLSEIRDKRVTHRYNFELEHYALH